MVLSYLLGVNVFKYCYLTLIILIIKGFQTIVFILISTTFRPICPPAFFRCLLNSGTYTELRTSSFIESTEVACYDSVSHNRVQVLSIPVLVLACSQGESANDGRVRSLGNQRLRVLPDSLE